MSTNVGIGRLGLGWLLEGWNRLDRDQLGVDKIGWELKWLSSKEEVGIGIYWMLGS